MLPEGIYQGWVLHQRYLPRKHSFKYPLAMLLLDLDNLQQQFKRSRLWSLERFNLISFYRRDYLRSDTKDLKTAVSELIRQRCAEDFHGQIKILTHPRYLGFIFNPVTFYFCSDGDTLKYIIADINNTPWNERHAYVLKVTENHQSPLYFSFDKQFHISPFMPMDVQYQWRFHLNPEALAIHMTLIHQGEQHFNASMQARMQPLNSKNMRWLPIRYPMQTLRVVLRIYWQALRLWGKHTPFFSHPDKQDDVNATANGDEK